MRISGRIGKQRAHLAVIDVTNGTDVHMGLGTLKSGGHATGSQLVAGKDMVDRVDRARAQQGRPAGACQQVQGTRDARHLAIGREPKNDGQKREQEGRSMGTRRIREESTAKFSGP